MNEPIVKWVIVGITLVPAIASAVAAYLLLQIERTNRQLRELQIKREVIGEFVSHTYTPLEFVRALNVLVVTFNDAPDVITAQYRVRKIAREAPAETWDDPLAIPQEEIDGLVQAMFEVADLCYCPLTETEVVYSEQRRNR